MRFLSQQVRCRPTPVLRAQKVTARVVQPHDQAPSKKRDFAKGLTPDVLQMFHDAQSNILELNKSRLQALEELKYARNRIQELEQTLKVYQENGAPAGVSFAENGNSAVASPPAPSVSQNGSENGNGNGASRSNNGGSPPGQSQRTDVIRLVYSSGWKKAFMHHRKNNESWTKIPGKQMQRATGEYEGQYIVEVDANSIEFVLTNGENDWDTPDPNSSNANYTIRSHGTYKLKSGRVHKLA